MVHADLPSKRGEVGFVRFKTGRLSKMVHSTREIRAGKSCFYPWYEWNVSDQLCFR